MNYSITINQKAIIESDLDLDLFDAVIIDCIRSFFASGKAKEYSVGGVSYKWVSAKKVAEDCPILGLKKDAIVKRLKVLEFKNVIERCPDNQIMSMSFFRAGQNWERLFRYQPTDTDTRLTTHIPSPYYPHTKPLLPTYQALATHIPSPMDVDTNYHNTNISNTNISNTKTKKPQKNAASLPLKKNDSDFDNDSDCDNTRDHGKKTPERAQMTGHVLESAPAEKEKICAKKEKTELPFGPAFAEAWAGWVAEKKAAHKFSYTAAGEKAALSKLASEAGTEAEAIAMIGQSIARGWKGLFPVKGNDKPIAAQQAPQTFPKPAFDVWANATIITVQPGEKGDDDIW